MLVLSLFIQNVKDVEGKEDNISKKEGRPPLDLFKAIFASSDSDSSSSEEDVEEKTEQKTPEHSAAQSNITQSDCM